MRRYDKGVIDYLGDRHRIIDIGYGNAHLLKKLREVYPQKEPVGIEILRRKQWTEESNIHNLMGSLEHLPFSSGSFDGLICTFVLDYIDKQKAIEEIQRVLRFDGKAAVYLHHPNSGLIDKFKKELFEDPENSELKYYVDTLESNIFKSVEECEKFFERKMLIEQLGLWNGSDSKDDTKKEYCFELFLRNRNFIVKLT
ncbi:MAG: methyltransferase domain-containing protein [Candidatus Aenigmarchaeota archaeon]|nr:methyltransferase domain-containing protein [Candidatus Aenigmarchaeota archaeon]